MNLGGDGLLVRRVLVMDDTPAQRAKYVNLILGNSGRGSVARREPIMPIVAVAASGEEALQRLEAARNAGQPFHVLATDLHVSAPGIAVMNGIGLIEKLGQHGFSPTTLEVILISEREQLESHSERLAVAERVWGEPIRKVFRSSLASGVDADAADAKFLEAIWESVGDVLAAQSKSMVTVSGDSDDEIFIGTSPAIVKLRDRATKMASSPARQAHFLILGESGVGKGELARFIHANSGRKDHPFEKYDLGGGAPADLLKSELFGHKKGAYTGATRDRQGLFERAGQGTAFLDELGNAPLELQNALMTFLEDGRICPLGAKAEDEKISRARLIFGTNVDVEKAIAAGKLKHDFIARIVFQLSIPPLRERLDDIDLLAPHHLAKTLIENGKSPSEKRFTDQALKALKAYQWPGNIRQLRDMILRMVTMDFDRDFDEVLVREHLEELGSTPSMKFPDGLGTLHARLMHVHMSGLLDRLLHERRRINATKLAELYWQDLYCETPDMAYNGIDGHKGVCTECSEKLKVLAGRGM